MPNLKFLASTVAEIWRGSQNSKSRSRDPFTYPFDLILHFLLGPQWPVCVPNLKFLASPLPRYRGGPKILKVGHVTPSRPLMTKFCILSVRSPVANSCAKFDVSSFNRSRDMEGSQNSKSRSRDPFTTPFDLILHNLVRTSRVQSAKVKVSSFNRFRNMEGVT